MLKKHNLFKSASLFFSLFLMAASLFSQTTAKSVTITRTENPPKIDGLIDDDCWKGLEPASGFYLWR